MAKKPKVERIDGFGPAERKKVHAAVRQVWYRSRAYGLVKRRCVDADGFPRCELCRKRVPHISVDHIDAVGEVGGPRYIEKMFVPSTELQGICKKCHAPKTKADNAKSKAVKTARKRKAVKGDIDDFF